MELSPTQLQDVLALYEQGRPYRRAAAVPQGAR